MVEDNDDNQVIYELVLGAAGYAVVIGENGAIGIDAARKHLPDLILLDLSMPVMDGRETIRAIRMDPALADIPVWPCLPTCFSRETTSMHCARALPTTWRSP